MMTFGVMFNTCMYVCALTVENIQPGLGRDRVANAVLGHTLKLEVVTLPSSRFDPEHRATRKVIDEISEKEINHETLGDEGSDPRTDLD